jgi:glycosyltransferase involved in cell wall biosynthesis
VTAAPERPVRPDAPTLLYLATVPQPIRNFYLPYADHFRSAGWRVLAAAAGATGDAALAGHFDAVEDLAISRSVLDPRNYFRTPLAVRRLVGSGIDVVHVHTPIASFVARLVARTLPRSRRPAVVYTAHGFHFHRGGSRLANAAFHFAERLAGRWTDRLIVINDEDERAARQGHFVPRARLVRLPGVGIDLEHYRRDRIAPGEIERARANLGAAPASPVFVVVGELHRNKRHRDVLAAFAALGHPNAVLAIVGEGRERTRLEALAASLGVAERVRFTGFVRDVRPVVACASALLLVSGREGLPRAVMEAMALEVPVIVSNSRGSVELVGDGFGQVAPVGDVPALARAMRRVADGSPEIRAMAERARRRVEERYGLDEIIAAHERIFEALLVGVREDRARVGT